MISSDPEYSAFRESVVDSRISEQVAGGPMTGGRCNVTGQRFATPPSRLSMLRLRAFYAVKHLVPRAIQIYLRRRRSRYLLANHLHEWPVDLTANGKPRGWQGWPNQRKFALVLTHDVESARGVELAN